MRGLWKHLNNKVRKGMAMPGFWERAIGAVSPAPPARDQAPLDAWWAPKAAPPSLPPQSPAPQPPQPTPTPVQAQSSHSSARCPHCASGNYFRPSPETKARCYECGYPVLHSTSGMTSTDRSAATPTRQVNKEGGFNPTTIVGRVG